ncbi:MAG: hypothetical protein IT178_01375 [Acidobacteria bacterium]|nr:hypothetical protein [Acidobacteriota bacterium]
MAVVANRAIRAAVAAVESLVAIVRCASNRKFSIAVMFSGTSVACDLGYSDQSHLIAEFQELAGLTPVALATRRWFHPFILDAQASATPSVALVVRASREKTGKPAV